MKRFLALLLAFAMTASMLPAAYAEEPAEAVSEEIVLSEESPMLLSEEPEIAAVLVRFVCPEGASIEVRDASSIKQLPVSEGEPNAFLLMPGTYYLSAWAEGYVPVENQLVLVEAGAAEQQVPVSLTPVPVEEETVAEEAPVEEEPVAEEIPTEEETVAEEIPTEEETVAEEAPTEEEPVAEEIPVEEETVAEEIPVEEETVAEEIPTEEETVAEEVPTEEETVAEEIPTEEEPGAEEAPTEEEPGAEEVPTEEETVAEEVPVEEETVTEEIPVEEETVAEEVPTEEETVAEETPVEEETEPAELDPSEMTFGSPADLVGVTEDYLQRHPWLQASGLQADEPVPTEAAAYSAMVAFKGSYPEGTPYTNNNYYEWNGGVYSGGYGCAGFAFMLSDAAFGRLPARKVTPVSIGAIHVGDILRVNGDTHSVIVLEVKADSVVIAEGNYNSSVHWGRVLSAGEVAAADYYMTRYPSGHFTGSCTVTFDANGGSGAPSAIQKGRGEAITLPATQPTQLFHEFLGWAASADATEAAFQPGESYNIDGDVTLYAVWQSVTYPDLAMGQNSAVIAEGGATAFLRFVPAKTGRFTFESSSTKDADGILYLETGTILAADQDSGSGANFKLSANLTAGTVYVLAVRYYSNSDFGTIPVTVTLETGDSGLPTLRHLANDVVGVFVNWNPVEGASRYRVFYKIASGDWTEAGDSTQPFYTVKGLTSGETYFFMVRCLNASGTDYTTPALDADLSIRYVAAPRVKSVTNVASGVTITWDEVPGADSYFVLKQNNSLEWDVLGNTTATSYTVTGLVPGEEYTFSVSCAEKRTETEIGPVSAADPVGGTIRYLSAPALTSVANKTTGVAVSWEAVPGAEFYFVLQQTAPTEWKIVGQTDGTSYTVTGLTSGLDYTFTVACGERVSETETKLSSAYDTIGKTINFVAAPKISSVSNTSKGVSVKWNAVEGAQKYRVSYKVGSGSWVEAMDAETNSCTVTGLNSGVKYTFMVRVVSADGTENLSSYYSSGKSITYIAAPTVDSVTNTAKGVTVKWTAPEGAVNYRVMYKKGSGSWVTAGETKSTSYTVSGLESGAKYTFTVRAINADGTKTASSYTSGKSLTVLSIPVISSVSNSETGVTVKWGAVTGAAKYRVYYRIGSGDWKKAGDTTSTSYTVKGLSSGTTYKFAVRCVSSDGKTLMGDRSSYKSKLYVAAPTISSVANVKTGVTVKWQAVPGAVNYRVYKKTGTGSWKKVADTTDTSYTVTGLESGKTYSFTVRCVSASGESTVSAYNSTGKSIQFLSVPSVSSVSNSKSGVTVKWKAVPGAEKYRVYYKTGSGDWKKAGDTTSTSYTVKNLTSNTTYKFSVRVISSDGTKLLTDRSSYKSKLYIAAPVLKKVENDTTGVHLEWDPVPGAVNYVIFYKTGSGDWTECGQACVTSVTIPGLDSGKTYRFTVRCANSNGAIYTSGYDSTGKSIKYIAAPMIESIEAVANGLNIKWKPISGAKAYEVLYRTASTQWTRLGLTTSTGVTAAGLTPGVPYSFSVRCVSEDGTKVLSAYDTTGVTYSYVQKPSIISLSCTSTGLVTNWTAVPGAELYGVLLREGNGEWVELGMTVSAGTAIYGITPGKTYSVSIVAIAADGSISAVDLTGVSIVYKPVSKPTDAQKDAMARVVAKGIADSVLAYGYKTDLEKVTAAAEMVYLFCLNAEYTMEGVDYRIPYGLFIKQEFSCAGSTRALGMVLEYMGYSWEHVNPNQNTHQWCRVVMDGQVGWADGMAGSAGYGKYLNQ